MYSLLPLVVVQAEWDAFVMVLLAPHTSVCVVCVGGAEPSAHNAGETLDTQQMLTVTVGQGPSSIALGGSGTPSP